MRKPSRQIDMFPDTAAPRPTTTERADVWLAAVWLRKKRRARVWRAGKGVHQVNGVRMTDRQLLAYARKRAGDDLFGGL